MASVFRTGILIAALTALFGAIGLILGGKAGMMIALGIAAAMNVFSYWNADKIVLRMYNARQVDPASASGRERRFAELTSELAHRAGMPQPKIYIIDNDQPNAFATGRNPDNAAVAATTGLLAMLSDEEVAGVMAHELSHVQHRDTLTMTVTATLAGAIGMLANFALFFGGGRDRPGGLIGSIAIMIFAPLAAALVQMAISRTREYEADRRGAEICGHPLWLASALAKISQGAAKIPNPTAERFPSSGQMMIVNPLSGRGADNLFSTHPDTQNRIDRLVDLARSMGQTHAYSEEAPSHVGGPWENRPGTRGPWG